MLTFLLLLFFINIHPTNSETTNFIRFSGDAMHDFPNTSIVIVDEGNNVTRAMFDLDRIRWYGEPSDVVMPSTLANMRSGWDMRQVLVAYDAESDVMHFGIVFYGIAGDADGDGNASSTSGPLAMLNGVDRPVCCNLIHQFYCDILLNKPSSIGARRYRGHCDTYRS